ncbi:MAG: hypothetical protein WAV38_04615 [Xanthobacteraceae bacterium]|jgi:hypothetical protein
MLKALRSARFGNAIASGVLSITDEIDRIKDILLPDMVESQFLAGAVLYDKAGVQFFD